MQSSIFLSKNIFNLFINKFQFTWKVKGKYKKTQLHFNWIFKKMWLFLLHMVHATMDSGSIGWHPCIEWMNAKYYSRLIGLCFPLYKSVLLHVSIALGFRHHWTRLFSKFGLASCCHLKGHFFYILMCDFRSNRWHFCCSEGFFFVTLSGYLQDKFGLRVFYLMGVKEVILKLNVDRVESRIYRGLGIWIE